MEDWLVAIGTIILAFVAVFQQSIRNFIYKPILSVSIKTEPPDCVAVPYTKQDGSFIANTVYLRIWVENTGKATAKNVEVYAKSLKRQRADNTWEIVKGFPPMNLVWANYRSIYFPTISPGMGKHCDIGHITDPEKRHVLNEDSPKLKLTTQQASFAFDLMTLPNHRGHIIGPGDYLLEIMIASENSKPVSKEIKINITGLWSTEEEIMLRDGIGLQITK